jgi:hypothetical protein
MVEAAAPRARGRALVGRVAPWLIAAVALAWLFHIVPLRAVGAALSGVNIGVFIAVAAGYIGLLLVTDSLATWASFRYAIPDVPLRYADVLVYRGASYLLGIVHYGVGQGGLAYFLHRRRGIPLARAAGAVLIVIGVNMIMVALSALLGVALGGAPAAPALRLIVVGLAAAFPIYLLVIGLRPAFLARRALLAPLFDAGVRGHLVGAVARLPHITVLIGMNYLAMRCFGVKPPIGQALALLPLVFIVATLPLAPSGIGTSQATAVALFTPFAAAGTVAARQAAVLGYSLALQFIGLAFQALVGLCFLRAASAPAKVEP